MAYTRRNSAGQLIDSRGNLITPPPANRNRYNEQKESIDTWSAPLRQAQAEEQLIELALGRLVIDELAKRGLR